MLAFMALGFLGTIEFVSSADLASKWVLLGGSLLGLVAGVVFALLAALVHNIIPALGRSVHPLALVRAGFVLITLWPLVALIAWPSASWGFQLGPVVAVAGAWLAVRANPHAELVPHSTLGRGLGTAVGPLFAMAFLLAVLIPMFNRGFGQSYSPRLIFLAVDGVDGSLLNEMLASGGRERFPRLATLKDNGAYAQLSSEEPLIAARLWADMLTGTGWEAHGIMDRHSTAADLARDPLWEILRIRGISCGLFQMLPVHPPAQNSKFDIPPPEDPRAGSDQRARALAQVRAAGRGEWVLYPWDIAYSACRLARLGVRLETITDLLRELVWERLTQPSPRLVYARRKLMQFQVEADCALALMRSRRAEAVFLRFPGLEPLFLEYWRYSKPRDFGQAPGDVDCALAAGLVGVLPDAYGRLDELVGSLQSYTGNRTVFVIVSNHGERSATDRRRGQWLISPERLLEITGWQDRALGDATATGVCFRAAGAEEGTDELADLEALLVEAEWSPSYEQAPSAPYPRRLFSVVSHPECIEVSIQTSGELESDSSVTIGDRTCAFSDIVATAEPRAGIISDSGLFLAAGPQFRRGAGAGKASVPDIAPTVLHALGIGLAEYLEGSPLDQLYDEEWLEHHSPVYVERYEPPVSPPQPFDLIQPSAGAADSVGVSILEEEPGMENAPPTVPEPSGP